MPNWLLLNGSMNAIDPSGRTLGHRTPYRRFSQDLLGEVNRLANRRPRLLTHAESKAVK